jgi:FKBP-type peptidyl-prolyl cis-trans isomerase
MQSGKSKKQIFSQEGVRMRKVALGALIIALCTLSSSCKTKTAAHATSLVTTSDSVSYIIGTDMGRQLTHMKENINTEAMIAGINDEFSEKEPKISMEQAQTIMQAFSIQMRQKQAEKNELDAKKNTEEGAKFLEENKKKPGIVITGSGLQYQVLSQGGGPVPKATDKVKVHYSGTTIDDKEFDSSYKRGEPVVFGVTQVIKGWTEALQLMRVGSKYKLFIPGDIAYGLRGSPPKIGPNAVLIFEVELLGIEQ